MRSTSLQRTSFNTINQQAINHPVDFFKSRSGIHDEKKKLYSRPKSRSSSFECSCGHSRGKSSPAAKGQKAKTRNNQSNYLLARASSFQARLTTSPVHKSLMMRCSLRVKKDFKRKEASRFVMRARELFTLAIFRLAGPINSIYSFFFFLAQKL